MVGNEPLATPQFDGRAHFFAAAAEAMRRILIDNARRKKSHRHGGGAAKVDIHDLELAASAKDDELLAVDDALEKLLSEGWNEGEGGAGGSPAGQA